MLLSHSRFLTEHLLISLNVASPTLPALRVCLCSAAPHITGLFPHSAPSQPPALPGKADEVDKGVRPQRAAWNGPTSHCLVPLGARLSQIRDCSQEVGVCPWCADSLALMGWDPASALKVSLHLNCGGWGWGPGPAKTMYLGNSGL